MCVMLKELLFFNKFYNFFCQQHSLMNRPSFNDLFQIMQQNNFGNLNGVILTLRKHQDIQVNTF